MILVLLAICIAVIGLGVYVFCEHDDDLGVPLFIFGGIGFIIAFAVTMILAIKVTNLAVIDEKIEMYQSENAVIETQITEIVEEYQKYETDIFTELSPEAAITYVSLYPELKSDTLVQQQIEVYVSNNQKIKEFKERKISGKVAKWWLYFGGGK